MHNLLDTLDFALYAGNLVFHFKIKFNLHFSMELK